MEMTLLLILLALVVAYHLEFTADDEDEDVHELDSRSHWGEAVEMWAAT
jgi:hypothetical protein